MPSERLNACVRTRRCSSLSQPIFRARALRSSGSKSARCYRSARLPAIRDIPSERWSSLGDNGGQVGVELIDRDELPRFAPRTYWRRPLGPLTIFCRVRCLMRGEPIEYTTLLDGKRRVTSGRTSGGGHVPNMVR
jgi:hypothetical protein